MPLYLLKKYISFHRHFQFSQLDPDTKTKSVIVEKYYTGSISKSGFSLYPRRTKYILQLNCDHEVLANLNFSQRIVCKTCRKIQSTVHHEYAESLFLYLTYGVASLLSFYQNCISTKEL